MAPMGDPQGSTAGTWAWFVVSSPSSTSAHAAPQDVIAEPGGEPGENLDLDNLPCYKVAELKRFTCIVGHDSSFHENPTSPRARSLSAPGNPWRNHPGPEPRRNRRRPFWPCAPIPSFLGADVRFRASGADTSGQLPPGHAGGQADYRFWLRAFSRRIPRRIWDIR